MKKLSITLPHQMAAWVRAKVASGEYASASGVIREGLAALDERNKLVQQYLSGQPRGNAEAAD